MSDSAFLERCPPVGGETAYFPIPYPDEAAFSILARLRSHLGMNPSRFDAEFFRKSVKGTSPTMPARMDQLARLIPARMGYPLERIVSEHTAVDYYSAFMPPARRDEIIADYLLGDQLRRPPIGQAAIPMSKLTHLRFCPECKREQHNQLRETYWRLSHQMPIVAVCVDHQTPLRSSTVKRVGELNCFVMPNDRNCPTDANAIFDDDGDVDMEALHQIAEAAIQLLNGCYPLGLHRTYPQDDLVGDLAVKGFFSTRIRWEKLNAEAARILRPIRLAYPRLFEGHEVTPWLLHSQSGMHPWYSDRVLMAKFIVDRLTGEDRSLGSGPWPCLNPLGDHKGKLTVRDARRLRQVGGKTYWRFTCDCGYAYTRYVTEGGDWGAHTVWDFGPSLDRHIANAIASGHSLRQVHMKAGVGANTMLRHAAKRGIAHPWREVCALRNARRAAR